MTTPQQAFLYTVARPRSLPVRIATAARRRMFTQFMALLAPGREDTVLDVGVTSDRTLDSSNYFEALYPHKDRIVAAGLDDAHFLEALYPGVQFRFADACDLPFGDGSFDYVHCSAVIEHVGAVNRQAALISECLRVARRGVCITTPDRAFPVEVHTVLPFLHWLPKPWFRYLLRHIWKSPLAEEANLNLLNA